VKINDKRSFKWLGVVIDCHLSMDEFVSSTCQSCYGILRMLRQIRSSIDKKCAIMLCNALVCSRIDYFNSLLIHTKQTHYERLQNVLNLAARIISGTQRSEYIAPALKELGWLKIKSRVVMKIAVLVFKALNGLAPSYLSDGLQRYYANRSLRSND
jgi:hypothetical protein